MGENANVRWPSSTFGYQNHQGSELSGEEDGLSVLRAGVVAAA